MQPVLLPFWFFEAAIKVDYCAQVLFLDAFKDTQCVLPKWLTDTCNISIYGHVSHHLVSPSACLAMQHKEPDLRRIHACCDAD